MYRKCLKMLAKQMYGKDQELLEWFMFAWEVNRLSFFVDFHGFQSSLVSLLCPWQGVESIENRTRRIRQYVWYTDTQNYS